MRAPRSAWSGSWSLSPLPALTSRQFGHCSVFGRVLPEIKKKYILASSAGVLLLVGALPMANVLMVGILIAEQRPRSRPFLLGFEVFGAIALALYIYLATPSSPAMPMGRSFRTCACDRFAKCCHQAIPACRSATIGLLVGVTVIVGPQLVFALIGGFLSYRLKITVTRR